VPATRYGVSGVVSGTDTRSLIVARYVRWALEERCGEQRRYAAGDYFLMNGAGGPWITKFPAPFVQCGAGGGMQGGNEFRPLEWGCWRLVTHWRNAFVMGLVDGFRLPHGGIHGNEQQLALVGCAGEPA
jgi:hypothetical protein